ncbi:hypothetical protein [Sphingomonas sp. OK281]|uniref:hypothetical protein n=1 Tax=Sphingomonas sp. OK281 TaxID=1881067 RepID=UPI0020C92891|nr:hypothetical protein [Sphingomonas sp. OK281]
MEKSTPISSSDIWVRDNRTSNHAPASAMSKARRLARPVKPSFMAIEVKTSCNALRSVTSRITTARSPRSDETGSPMDRDVISAHAIVPSRCFTRMVTIALLIKSGAKLRSRSSNHQHVVDHDTSATARPITNPIGHPRILITDDEM